MVELLKKRQQKSKVNPLIVLAFITIFLHVFTLALLVLQGLTIRQFYLRKPPTFIQLINGKRIDSIDMLERNPLAVQQFVGKFATLMFDWSGKLPPQTIQDVSQPKSDPGISIRTKRGNKTVSTSSWMAGFAISEDFRQAFLREIADITPPEVFSRISDRAISTQLVIKRIDQPEKIAPGKWRVGIVANLVQTRTSNNRQIITPFNKIFLLRSVDYFDYPQASSTTDLQRAIYDIRSDKLEIYEIRDLCLLDNSNNNFSNNFCPE